MSANHSWQQPITKFGFLLMMGASMSVGAGFFGFGGDSWKEEALLHDGSSLLVTRSIERGGRHEIGQKPSFKEQSLSFILPNVNQVITWKDHYSEALGSANFLPMLLDIYKGTVYLVVSPMGCLSYNKWGRPNPPYVIFKYDANQWARISLQELPSEITAPNLIISDPDAEVKKRGKTFITAAEIKQANTGFNQPEFRRILREAIKPPAPGSSINCPIPTTAAAKPIAPEIDGKPLQYNWWPLAQDWLDKTYRGNK